MRIFGWHDDEVRSPILPTGSVHSYTGAFVNFYVDKASGTTRLEEYVPSLDVKSDAGTINLFDYLMKDLFWL